LAVWHFDEALGYVEPEARTANLAYFGPVCTGELFEHLGALDFRHPDPLVDHRYLGVVTLALGHYPHGRASR
jgi:hypothetical protein